MRDAVARIHHDQAQKCLAMTSSLEANVLDARGEKLVDTVVMNRAARRTDGKPLYFRVCESTAATHWNAKLRQRVPDFSAFATAAGKRLDKIDFTKRAHWPRSLAVADEVLAEHARGERPLLPPGYIFYHSGKVPKSFRVGRVCDYVYHYKKYTVTFCRLS